MAENNIRKKGTAIFAVNFEPTGQSPLDARLVVENRTMLIDDATYGNGVNNYYEGMAVIVKHGGENGDGKSELWVLRDVAKFNNITGWQRLDADASALENDIESAIGSLSSTTSGSGSVVTNVTQAKGKVTVTKGDLASTQVTATAVTAGNDTVAIEGTTVDTQIKSLGKTLKTVQDNAAKYEVVKLEQSEIDTLTDADKDNIKEAYKVVSYVGDGDKTQVGDLIKIYKDSALKGAELSADGQKLVLTYTTADGSDDTVEVDFNNIAFNAEFKNGLVVNAAGEISVKIDSDSEDFLTVGANGVKLDGVQDAINDTIATEIDELNATKGGTTIADGKHVAVQVVETKGKLTSVTVTESDIASASDLSDAVTALETADTAIKGRLDVLEGANTVAGSVKKTVKDAIDALDYNDTAVANQFVTEVDEVDGKIEVKRGPVAASGVTASAVNGDTNTIGLSGETVAAQITEIATAIKSVKDEVSAVGGNDVEKIVLNGTDLTPTNNTITMTINGSVINWKAGTGEGVTTIEDKLNALADSIDTKIAALDGNSVKADSDGKLEVVLGTDLSKALEITDNGLEWLPNALIDCGTI